MADITLSLDDTLELDEIIQEWSRTDSNLSLNGDESSFDISGLQTKTSILNPQEPGNYTITINGQDLSVKVRDPSTIPDSAVHQWTADTYDDGNDEFPDQVGSATLTSNGGTGSLTTDSEGNTVVKTDGLRYENSNVSVSNDRVVIAMVYEVYDSNNLYGDAWQSISDNSVRLQHDSGGPDLQFAFGVSRNEFGTPSTGKFTMFAFGPKIGSNSTDRCEMGSGEASGESDTGSTGINGITVTDGEFSGNLKAYLAECVIYQNPSQQDIDNEKSRLDNKYSGYSPA